MRHSQSLLALAAFVVAAALCYLGAVWAVSAVEARSTELVQERLSQEGLDWVHVRASGLQVHLGGIAPTEAQRFRAITVTSSEVDPGRIRDDMGVTPTKEIAPPRFSLELLRNENGISLIGLVPAATGHDPILARVKPLADGGHVTDMLETSDNPKPEHWDAALNFGLDALKLLPRSKVSIFATRVSVRAISDSGAQKSAWESELAGMTPKGVKVALDITAPRPVITPFTLRFLDDAKGARFDACSADTEEARGRILAAARQAGAKEPLDCTIGLGVPSPEWADAVVQGIAAVRRLGDASITFSDADVTLLADSDVAQAKFDQVVGDLDARLPDVFSLKATLTPKPKASKNKGPTEFTAMLSPEGQVQLRGRVASKETRAAVTSFAKAAFGAGVVYNAAVVDPDLPDGWPVRVLAGLQALAELHQGALLVRPDKVSVIGISGHKDASDTIARILSDKLGQGKDFSISVKYDKALDPLAALPTPQECVDSVNAILAKRQVTFDPGSDRPDAASQDTLDALADALRPCERVRMEVAGYTDNQGRAEMNLALSQRRAQAVLNALLERRVTIGNLVAKGYGEADPIADNSTDAGREANRRIEFSLIDKGGDGAEGGAKGDGTAAPDAEGAAPEGAGDAAKAAAADADAVATGAAEAAKADAGAAPSDNSAGASDTGAASGGGGQDGGEFESAAPTEKTIMPRPRPGE